MPKAEAAATEIQFVADDKGSRVAVQIDLKRHGATWEDFWDGLISESRRKEKSIAYENTAPVACSAQPVAWLTRRH